MPETSPALETTPPMRCRHCYYILDHLSSNICPECGTIFDPLDLTTFTRKPPFVWWTFWLPALLLAGVGGGVLWIVLIAAFNFTCATTLVVPIAIGATVGYAGRAKFMWKILLSLIALGAAIAALASVSLVGGFCAAIMGLLALIPVLVGVTLGTTLRVFLKKSNFSQASYLRSIFFQMMVVFLTVAAAAVEGRYPLAQPVSLTTSQTINAPPDQAWHGIQFFEEVRRPVPWLLLLSPSLRPMYTIGHSEKVGDLKTCIYQHGKLVKRISEVIPGKRLAFRVVEQDDIETNGAILLDGSFDLQPINNGRQTRVVLTTRYVPLLNPRFAYQWAEAWAIHTLHGHVLAGMKDTAEGNRQ